ncbi:MAG: HAD family hydrolase [Gammaproteobacteria bacterium]|nr:MAG: HAD family hydrolase [Gammaproteobacteria bacterium]
MLDNELDENIFKSFKENYMKLVIFDVFGTLIRYAVRHSPYRQLIKCGRAHGRKVSADDARKIMTSNCEIRELADHLKIRAPLDLLNKLENQIDEEMNAISLFDDVEETLSALLDRGIQIAICSNLAMPYGKAIDNLLSDFRFSRFLSYELCFMKPDIEIYRMISESTNICANESLFVGDNFQCDYLGPINCGFHARHLVRHYTSCEQTISNLSDVLTIVSSVSQ